MTATQIAGALLLFTLGAPGCVSHADSGRDDDAAGETEQASVTHYEARVTDTLSRGSQPDNASLASLARRGFESIVNLRTGNGEASEVTRLGMKAEHIGVGDGRAPSFAQVDTFLAFATTRANQPVFVHCEGGAGRTGVFVAAYRMNVQGWTRDAAVREGIGYGLGSADQFAFLTSYADALARGTVRRYAAVR